MEKSVKRERGMAWIHGEGTFVVDCVRVSVIVPCRNEKGYVLGLVQCIAKQRLNGLRLEVIVADGMSTDGTRNLLRSAQLSYPWLRVVDNPDEIVSSGLNRAIAACSGDVIVRMDVHSAYPPDYIYQCVTLLLDSQAWNVGGYWMAKGTTQVGRAVAAAFHSWCGTGGAKWHNPHDGPVDTVPFGCWRKQTLLDLGLFDESLVRNQDDELNLRIVRSGGVVWQSSKIYSWYTPRSSLKALFKQQFQYGFWKVAVIRKHRLPASWRHLVPAAFAAANLLLPLTALLSHFAGAASVSRATLALWALEMAAYLLFTAVASLHTASRHGWSLLPLLPVVFATYHTAYGAGFLTGLLNWSRFGRSERIKDPAFTSLSR